MGRRARLRFAQMTAGSGPQCWVVVLAEAEGLRWVLEHSRMAWTEASATRASRIRPGDRIVLYVGRGAFHNPTRDESQLLGFAEVTSPVRRLPRPVELGGRTFVVGCDLRLERVLPERHGVPIRPLVGRLSFVKRKDVWGQYCRGSSGRARVALVGHGCPDRDGRPSGTMDRLQPTIGVVGNDHVPKGAVGAFRAEPLALMERRARLRCAPEPRSGDPAAFFGSAPSSIARRPRNGPRGLAAGSTSSGAGSAR